MGLEAMHREQQKVIPSSAIFESKRRLLFPPFLEFQRIDLTVVSTSHFFPLFKPIKCLHHHRPLAAAAAAAALQSEKPNGRSTATAS